jgi:NAD(P)H-dependent flavin oxidoreductase YrpB (nitropropane dioxygenase family)
MKNWPDRRLLDLFGISLPIIQAPMAGPGTPELAMAVSDAGGLGSLPCAQLSVEQARAAASPMRAASSRLLHWAPRPCKSARRICSAPKRIYPACISRL